MTTQGKITTSSTTTTRRFTGEFEELPQAIHYGQAGLRQPHSFSLEVTDFNDVYEDGKTRAFTAYDLTLYAYNASKNSSFPAKFGFPSAPSMTSYDYGYGHWGFIHEAPEEVIRFLADLTGIDLVFVVAQSAAKAEEAKEKAASKAAIIA